MDSVGIDITTKDIVLLLANIVLGVPVGLLLGWYVGRPVSHALHRHVTSTARGREALEGPQDHRDRSGTSSTGRHHALTGQAPGASTVSTDLSIPPASSAPSPSTEIRTLVDHLDDDAAAEVLAYACWVLGEGRLVPPATRRARWRDRATERLGD